MKRIKQAGQSAIYNEIKAIMEERGRASDFKKLTLAAVFAEGEGFVGAVELFSSRTQVNEAYFENNKKLNPNNFKLYTLNHAAGRAE